MCNGCDGVQCLAQEAKGKTFSFFCCSNAVLVLGTSQMQSYCLKIAPRTSPMLSHTPSLMQSQSQARQNIETTGTLHKSSYESLVSDNRR